MNRGLVGFSQYMGTGSMLSLGLVLGFGVWILLSGPVTIAVAGGDSVIGLLVATLVFLPVILCLVSRASEARGGYTPYAVVRRSGSPRLLYATGWLSLAGYISIAALMVESVGARLDQQFKLFVGIDVPLIVLVAPITAIAGVAEILAPNEHPRFRSAVRWFLVIVTLGFLLWVTLFPPPVAPGVEIPRVHISRWLSVVAVPAAGLWVIALLLDHRPQFRSSDKKLAGVLVLVWLACGLTTVWATDLVQDHQDLTFRTEGVMHIVWARERLRLISAALGYAVCIIALVKCLTRATRLAGSMAVDGLFPESFQQRESSGRLPGAVLVTLSILVSLLGAFADANLLVGVAAVSVLWVSLIAIGLGFQNKTPPRAAALKLPLHPFLPMLAIGVCAFFSVIVPDPAVLVTSGWLGVGFLLWPAFRARAVITSHSPSEVEAEPDTEEADIPTKREHRVLACLGTSTDPQSLVRVGVALARAHGGDLLVLRVISLLEQIPRGRVRSHAEASCKQLDALLTEIVGEDMDVHPVVRVAPTIEAGLSETAKRFNPDLVLLDVPGPSASSVDQEHLAFLEYALATTAQPVAVIRGAIRELPTRLLAAMAKGPDSATMLELGAALATAADGTLTAVHVHGPLEDESAVLEKLEQSIEEAQVDATPLLVEAENPVAGLSELSAEHDMLIVGCTRDRSTTATLSGDGLLTQVTTAWKKPLLMVRRREPMASRWFNRAWRQVFSRLPTLTTSERAEVYAEMRHSAAANEDFFVLIVIASAIATFGLVQNSAAVIIGAMLVAPLMSPIIAISQGIVQGNLSMIRRSLSSTAKGAAVSVAVATGFVLAFPRLTPTAEIMARTSPTLFDLGVGLSAGAAAAYGVSRKAVAAALPGTAISVALVPPLCVAGFGLASDRLDIGIGALLLFLTNLAAIVFVSVVTFLLLGFFPRDKDRHEKARGAIVLNILVLAMLSIPLGISSCHTTRVDALESAVEAAFRSYAESNSILLRNIDVEKTGGLFHLKAAVFADAGISQDEIQKLREDVEQQTGLTVKLEVLLLHADRLIAAPEEP